MNIGTIKNHGYRRGYRPEGRGVIVVWSSCVGAGAATLCRGADSRGTQEEKTCNGQAGPRRRVNQGKNCNGQAGPRRDPGEKLQRTGAVV